MRHTIRWTETKCRQRLALIEPLVHRRRHPLDPFVYQALPGPLAPPPLEGRGEWVEIPTGGFWGPPRTDFALRGGFTVPEGWSAPLALYLPFAEEGDFSHPETLVYLDGKPWAGCDRHHQEVRLPPGVADGREHELLLHGWTGMGGDWQKTDPAHRHLMKPASLVECCDATRALVARARVALGLVPVLHADDPARVALLNALEECFNLLDTREPLGEAFYASVPAATEALERGLSGTPLPVEVFCAGHAHIDVGWLWPVSQSRRKAGRTFHTVDRLMDEFPAYRFTQSQPQLYDYLRQDYPELFERIKERVREGRWECIGGMWVEADANLSGAEALVRQFLLGRRFFREHFGEDVESPVLWLPDVFGYTWSLPQLIKEAGLEYFMTIKIGWSQYNRMPVQSFWWQGLDGTRVLTHFSTAPDGRYSLGGTYNAAATAEQMVGTWAAFTQKESQDVLLMSYGYGDGGGGPTREMLENIEVMGSAPSCPQARMARVGDFFKTMESRSGERLPVWNGELYLEYHRGTYTTQAALKRGNRESENTLHTTEFLAVAAGVLDPGYTYPAELMREAWQLLCLNQFHDILPGSSIRQVNLEAMADYQRIAEIQGEVRAGLETVLSDKVGGDLVVANPTPFTRQTPFPWRGDASGFVDSEGEPVPCQQSTEGLWLSPVLPPYSLTPLRRSDEAGEVDFPVSASSRGLENAFLLVELDETGRIIRLYDKVVGREVLPAGETANQLQLFEDRPMQWDAWDIDAYYDDRSWSPEPVGVEVLEEGPLVGVVEVRWRYRNSTIVQRLRLTHAGARLDFDTTVDWHERHTLLKAAFPVDVLSPRATFEIQWGSVERPTHRNTSWDWARFEVPAHRWVDLSEGDYGVSLLNDCKYGHDVHGKVLRLSLLRSPTMPDPEADQGEHRFCYSLFPHAGPVGSATWAEAYALNYPVVCLPGGGGEGRPLHLVSWDRDNVIVETVKPAEDGKGFVVRLFEAGRQRGRVRLAAGVPLQAASRLDFLERERETLDPTAVSLELHPFQIATLRLEPTR